MSVPQIDKRDLSGSTDGRQVAVAATATPGTLLHTAQSGTTDGSYDEVWIWASNISAAAVAFTLEYGGVAAGDKIVVSLPANSGPILVCPGLLLQNSLVVRAFAASASVVNCSGFVNRLTA